MELLYKISEQLKLKNKTQKQLCEFLGLSRQTFSEWNAGRSNSYMKYLPQIAEFLDISVDYLVGNTDKKNKAIPEGQPLTEEQESLIASSSDLSNEDLKKVIEYIELLKLRVNQ